MNFSALPFKISIPFATSGTKNTIPNTSQIGITDGVASFPTGFVPLNFTPLTSGGVAPFGADFNGVLFDITAIQQWQSAGGQFIYDSAFSTAVSGYPKGAYIMRADQTGFWFNQADGNTTDPDGSSPTNWVPGFNYGITVLTGLTNTNVTLTALQAARNIVTLAGTLTGNIQIIFPTYTRSWTVINNTTGAFTVTCKTASGGGGVALQGMASNFYGNGTDLILMNSGSFAPLNNPAFTGTPTAPTASVNTSNTQLATTAFVNPSNSLGTTGFQKLASGLTIQWGVVATNTGGDTAVTFPVAFSTAVYQVIVSASGVTGSAAFVTSNTATTTGVNIAGWGVSGSRASTTASYYAIGA